MTPEQLAEIRARAEAATSGPWVWNSYSDIFADVPEGHPLAEEDPDGLHYAAIAVVCGGPTQRGDELHVAEAKANALFIQHAREDIPALLAEIERLQALLKGGES